MNNNYSVSQRNLRAIDINRLVDFPKHNGLELYHVLQGLKLFDTREINVGGGIGAMALDVANQSGVPMGVIAPYLGRLAYSGLGHLLVDIDNWQFRGSSEEVSKMRGWIGDGSEATRAHRIKEMFGIHARQSSQYLFVNADHTVETSDELETRFGQADNPFTIVLDAWAFANKLKNCLGGALFTFESGPVN